MLPLLTYDTICERSVRYRQELRIKRSFNVEKSFVPVGNELLQRIIRLQREVDRRGVEIALLRENLSSSGRNCRDASTNTDDSLFLDEPHYTFDRSRWSRIAIHAKRRRLSPNSRSPKRSFTAPSRINSESEGFVDRTPVSPVPSIESDHNVELDSETQHVPETKLAKATNMDSTPAKIENENAGKKDDGIILHSSSSSSATPRVRPDTSLQQLTQMLGIPTPTISAESKAEFARIQDNFKKLLNPTGEICEDESSRAEIVYEMYIPPRWPTIIISTDASDSALGAVHTDPTREAIIKSASRELDKCESQESSDVRELLAIKFAIEAFMVNKGVNSAILFTDSQNAVRTFRDGSRRNFNLLTEIRNLVRQHDLQIFFKWIPRELNKLADAASREVDFDDWQFLPKLFAIWNRKYGPCNVDRFATHITNQLPVFWSKYPCPGASGVDSLSVYWSGARGLRDSIVNWCVPPEDLLIPCIKHIMSHPCRGLLVMPDWKSHESSKLLAKGIRDGWAKIVDRTRRNQHVIDPVVDGFGPFKGAKLNFPMLCVQFDTFSLYDDTRFYSKVNFTLQ